MNDQRYSIGVLAILLLVGQVFGDYETVFPRDLQAGEVAVSGPGTYGKAGTTYVLTGDIRAPRSALFLGKNVVLDLNGYTVTYADGYRHLTNHDFSDALKGWNTARAPGARVENMTLRHPMVGANNLVLPEGEEITSAWITLPEAMRAYYAVVTVAHHQMKVGIYVEDEQGYSVECAYNTGSALRPCCPEPGRSPKLGGGAVFALLYGQPAGRYRVRVKAVEKECILGSIDLLPALDTGIGLVEKTAPWAYYKCILDGDSTAFFDYTDPANPGKPVASLPPISGTGKVTIRNGIVRSGPAAIRTWAVDSTAAGVEVHLENVLIQSAGLNACAVRVPYGTMKDCRIELDHPFMIDRHGTRGSPALFFSPDQPSEITGCTFVGGQGSLVVQGRGSRIHDCLFKPKQTVTNHYALHVGADDCEIFDNRFLPLRGSGVFIGRQSGNRLYRNLFEITSAPPNNEYGHTDFSTNAIRLSDYNAEHGNPRGWCENNHLYENTISVTARNYPGCHKDFKSMAYAVFMSVGGGQNVVHDNRITIRHEQPGSRNSGAFGFYVGGSNQGGIYAGNTLTSNVTPVWIGNRYGPARNVTLYNNTFVRPADAPPYAPIKLGWYKYPTENIQLFSNTFRNLEPRVLIDDYTTGYRSSYDLGWTLTIKAPPRTSCTILDQDDREVLKATTDANGCCRIRLVQYAMQGAGTKVVDGKREIQMEQRDVSRYTVVAGDHRQSLVMNRDQEVTLPKKIQ